MGINRKCAAASSPTVTAEWLVRRDILAFDCLKATSFLSAFVFLGFSIFCPCFLFQQAQHMNSSKWAMDRFPEILNLSNWAFNFIYQGTDELGRLLGGWFVIGFVRSIMEGLLNLKLENSIIKKLGTLNLSYCVHVTQ